MKIFKKFSTAHKAANDMPVVKFGSGKQTIYIVWEGDLTGLKLVEASLIKNGQYTGHITMGHLDRLGNANWAEVKRPIASTAFGPEPADM